MDIRSAYRRRWYWHSRSFHPDSLARACVQDALDEIARQKPKDLFKPLRVHFIGEDGIDAGRLHRSNSIIPG